jgi:hypothetical protein
VGFFAAAFFLSSGRCDSAVCDSDCCSVALGGSVLGSAIAHRVAYVDVITRSGSDLDHLHDRRLRALEREEHRTADSTGERGDEKLRNRVHGSRQEGRQNRPQDEHHLVDGGFQGVGGVELLRVGGPAQRIRPSRTHQRAEGELGQPHQHGQREQQRNRHTQQGRECEDQHRDDLQHQRDTSDAPLSETVEQPRIERRDSCERQNIGRAHRAGSRPVAIQMVQRQHDAQAHHRHRQPRHGTGKAEGLRPGDSEKLGVGRGTAG